MARKRTKLTYEKRRREQEKKRKRQDKLARKHDRGDGEDEAEAETVPDRHDDGDVVDQMFEDALNSARAGRRTG